MFCFCVCVGGGGAGRRKSVRRRLCFGAKLKEGDRRAFGAVICFGVLGTGEFVFFWSCGCSVGKVTVGGLCLGPQQSIGASAHLRRGCSFEWPGQGGACCFWGSAWKGGKAFGGISEISTRGNETPGEKWPGRPYAQPMVQQVSLSKKNRPHPSERHPKLKVCLLLSRPSARKPHGTMHMGEYCFTV